MNWVAYILQCSDGTLYTGATNNLEKRLKAHNAKRGAKYTRSRLPVILIWSSSPLSKKEALSLEYAIKQMSRARKLEYVKQV